MKTMIATTRSAIMIDTDTLDVKKINEDRATISSVYLIDEDCTIKCATDDPVKVFDASAGDILINFWANTFPNKWILVKDDVWAENIKHDREEQQKVKEEWAASKADCDSEIKC